MLAIRNFTQNTIKEHFFQRIARETIKIINQIDPRLKLSERTIEISLAIVGRGQIRRLNKMYRGKNRVTDVLSFANRSVLPCLTKSSSRPKTRPKSVQEIEFVEPPDGINRLGEIVICYRQAKKQAQEQGHSLEKELTHLLIHGILHLVGYEHEKDKKQAHQMQELEKLILAKVLPKSSKCKYK